MRARVETREKEKSCLIITCTYRIPFIYLKESIVSNIKALMMRMKTRQEKQKCINNIHFDLLLMMLLGCMLFDTVFSLEKIAQREETLIFSDDFTKGFDCSTWKHEITLGGGGNREFQMYINSRNNSYVKNNILHLKPTLTQDAYGKDFIHNGTMDLWGKYD